MKWKERQSVLTHPRAHSSPTNSYRYRRTFFILISKTIKLYSWAYPAAALWGKVCFKIRFPSPNAKLNHYWEKCKTDPRTASRANFTLPERKRWIKRFYSTQNLSTLRRSLIITKVKSFCMGANERVSNLVKIKMNVYFDTWGLFDLIEVS